jgi:signal transduction histidine kinase
MGPETSAVVLSATVTATVAAVGAGGLARLARRRPSAAALGAPVLVVVALAAGVAVASRSMLIGDDYRTLVFVLLAGAPMAVLVGWVLARQVWRREQDAARERAALERAREVESSRRETIRWLSHDLRTPLAGIRALAESLEAGAVADPRAAHASIVHEVDRMDGMVDDIAELSRLHGPGAASRSEAVGLDDLVSDAVAGVAPLAEADGVAIAAGHLSGATVEVDPRAVTRAVTNVLRNAVQHTRAGGRVEVSTTTGGGTARVEVVDGCGGIAPDELGRVFEPGWRGDHSRHDRGMGLGLPIAREAARAHGGEVSVENRPDGAGCVVSVVLPSAPGQGR